MIDMFMKIFRDNVMYEKELKRSYMKDDIEKFLRKNLTIETESNFFNIRLASIVLKNKNSNDDRIVDAFFKLTGSLIMVGSVIVDSYTMSRVFKKFNVKEGDNQPVEANNNIIYAGDAHCQKYREFLKTLGYTEEYFTGNSRPMMRCLNMHGVPQPLFRPSKY